MIAGNVNYGFNIFSVISKQILVDILLHMNIITRFYLIEVQCILYTNRYNSYMAKEIQYKHYVRVA